MTEQTTTPTKHLPVMGSIGAPVVVTVTPDGLVTVHVDLSDLSSAREWRRDSYDLSDAECDRLAAGVAAVTADSAYRVVVTGAIR